MQDRESIENAAVTFQLETSDTIARYDAKNVENIDQSAWQYEMHTGRSLEIRGEKKVEKIVQSKSATTHSFTIMPSITASGILKSPMYVVLQEDTGNKFGPRVRKNPLRV